MIDSLCIVGGGTSGMVAALMLKKAWPEMSVTVIESSKIGIVGVGEGSTEHWRKFIEFCDITVPELIRETGATFKIGIKFTNWHGDGTHYFHSLIDDYCKHGSHSGIPYQWFKMVGEQWDPLDTMGKAGQQSRHYEPLHENLNQYHFDTYKLNLFLHKKCSERGIILIDEIIDDVILDENGYVSSLIDSKGERHVHDFFIDCSGFRRVISDKLGAKWIDREHHLPMNSAIAFPTGYKEDIPSWTEATALSSGWVWRIPTQDRFGNGYVYSDNFISDDAALAEVRKHYKENLKIDDELKVGKSFKFKAGHLDKFWVKNCVSIGLSAIFVEPLEASSIGTTIQQCYMLLPSLPFFTKGEEFTAKKYNEMMTTVSNNIVDYIQLHYFTQRNDSAFWKWAREGIVKTDFNREYLEYFKTNMPNVFYFNDHFTLFKHLNFIQVMHGLRLFKPEGINEVYKKHLEKIHGLEIERMKTLNENEERFVTGFTHRESLELLKARQDEIVYKF